MRPNTPMNSASVTVCPVVDPLAVYQALWQDDTTGRAVLMATEGNAFCLISVNDALTRSPLWQTAATKERLAVEVLGKSLSDVFLSHIEQQFQHYCKVCDDTQQAVSFELPFLTEDESGQWWQFTLHPIIPFEQTRSQLILTATDISEFRRTEHRLKDAVQDVRTILDNIQEAVFIHDTTGKILDVNEKVLMLHGVTREEALRYSLDKEYALPESPIHLLPSFLGRALNGERVTIEWPTRRVSDAARRIVEVVLQKVVPSGQDRLIACVSDITERKALEEMQNRSLAILEATTDLVGIADAEGNNLYLNPAGQKMLGISAEESANFHISEAMPARAQKAFLENTVQQAIAQGSCTIEQVLINRAGEEFPVSQVLISHGDKAGECKYLSTIVRDISEFKAVEATLRDQQQFLDSIYRGANVVMFTWDVIDEATRELRCTGWNPAYVEATGLSEASVLGKTPIDVFGVESGGTVIERHFQCIESQQSIQYEDEIRFDGFSAWWHTKLSPIPIKDEAGKIYRVIGTTTNITETKLYNIELFHLSMCVPKHFRIANAPRSREAGRTFR